MAKTAAELLAERKKRIYDAIALKVPDRVPLFMPISAFGAKYGGITMKEAFENAPKWHEINEKLLLEYQPDSYMGPLIYDTGTNTILGTKLYKWPGNGIDENTAYQFVEGEYMKAEEYNAFLENPTDFIFRYYLPRTYSNVEGLKNMPSTLSLLGGGPTALFSHPAALTALKTIIKAVENSSRYMMARIPFNPKMEGLGFISFFPMGGAAPFDTISDFLRGLKGTTLDMYRCPDKLLAAQQKLLPFLIGSAVATCRRVHTDFCFTALHRGSDGFMSLKQFEEFYWPGLKAVLLGMIDKGLIPLVFWEGTWDQRLEYLRELPKGKVLGWFDRTNLFKAKEVIGDTMCICGDMPLSLLQTGTPEQVKAYAKKLIDVVGKGGGFIMSSNTVLDYARPDLVKVWVDFTREYGVYA
jgi:hypothetical protein